MKKLIALPLLALPFTALQAQTELATAELQNSTVTYDVQDGKKGFGRVESVNTDGSATLVDVSTGERKHLSNGGDYQYGAVVVGTPVEYIEITTPNGVIVIDHQKLDSILNLIR